MNLATHVLIGMGAFARHRRSALIAAGVGGAAPDLPTIALELWELWSAATLPARSTGTCISPQFGKPSWPRGTRSWSGGWSWARLGGAEVLPYRPVPRRASFHLACDLPLHAGAPHRHFWPLSDWRFASPVSSWHPNHVGQLIQALELALAVALGLWVYRQAPRPAVLASVAVLWLAFGVQATIYLALP